MNIVTKKCDGCGEEIRPVDDSILSNNTVERGQQFSAAGAMFLSGFVKAYGWVDHGELGGRNPVDLGLAKSFDVCVKCAETRTIASFKLQKSLA
jgi:hypothetical protein